MAEPDLRALARFLPEFERADFSPGSWIEMRKREDGVYTMPYATLSPSASEFLQAAYEGGWVQEGFDWPKWKETEEAEALYRGPGLLAQASPQQLAKLLTVAIRQDRFVEGGLLDDFRSGLILGIVRRAAALVAAAGDPNL